MSQTDRKNYMNYWHFTQDEKNRLITRLTREILVLRKSVKATQNEIVNAISASRQICNAFEMQKKKDDMECIYVFNFVF